MGPAYANSCSPRRPPLETPMKLYNSPGSPNALRSRAVAFELGFEPEIINVNIATGENRSAEFLKLNRDFQTDGGTYDTRLKFLVEGRDGGKGAPMSCAMIYWGERAIHFDRVFSAFGAVVDIRGLQGKNLGVPRGQARMLLFDDVRKERPAKRQVR